MKIKVGNYYSDESVGEILRVTRFSTNKDREEGVCFEVLCAGWESGFSRGYKGIFSREVFEKWYKPCPKLKGILYDY